MRTILLFIIAASIAFGAPPIMNRLEPWGVQRGKAFTLTILGSNLPDGARIVSNLPANFTPMTPSGEMAGKSLPFLVELKRDAAVGLYPIRLESPQGISNVLLFSVGSFAEVGEAESESRINEALNDTTATAQEIKSTPILVNGTLRPADRDYFKVYAKAGERRVFEVEARRMGSAVDPTLRILDSAGKLLSRVEDTPGLGVDCRIEYQFPREGHYFVEVHDARFSDQAANFYRLKMGAFEFAEGLFPLGGRRGQAVEVELHGGNLKASAKLKADLSTKKPVTTVSLPGSASLPMHFAVGDSPEAMEPAQPGPHPLALGTVMNGRILKPGERDRYRVAVKPGKFYMLELLAREFGTSRLDGVITVTDASGKRLASAGDQPPTQSVFATILAGDISRDPYVLFQAPDKVGEVMVTIDDLAGQGGGAYGYRLLANEQQPDFEASLLSPYVNIPATGAAIIPVNIDRRGYPGAITLKVANLPDDLTVSGGTIPPEIQDIDNRGLSRRGVLTVSAKPGAKRRALELEVVAEAVLPDGSTIRRKAVGPGMQTGIRTNQGFDPGRRALSRPFQAPWLGFDMPAMIGHESPGAIEVFTPPRVRLLQGEKQQFYWKFISSVPGTPRPDNVAPDTPGGRDLRISDRIEPRRAGAGMVQMNSTIGTPPGPFDVILSARVGDEIVYAPAVTVELLQAYYVDEPRMASAFKPGSKSEMVGRVRRETGFSAPITIAPDALPLGVDCHPAEVAPEAAEYRIVCEASAEAPPGEHKILLNPSSILPEGDKGKVPYKIAPVEATLVIGK